MQKRLLLIGSNTEVLKKAKNCGFYILLFQTKDSLAKEDYELADETFIFDWKDNEYAIEMAKLIHAYKPLDCVFSFGEQNVLLTAKIANLLNLDGNSIQSVELAKDKFLMRETLQKNNISPVQYAKISNYDEALKKSKLIGFPVIIKPINSWASTGVFKVEKESELYGIYKKIISITNSNEVLIEEYLDGNEISVEGITYNGEHNILAITQKYTTGEPNFIETGHIVPANLNENLEKEIINLTKSVLDVIGHRLGPSHTEIKLTSNGPRIIETHTRAGGDNITTLVNLSTGYDVFELMLQYLNTNKVVFHTKNEKKLSQINFLLLSKGVVESIKGLDEIRNFDFVHEINLNIKVSDQIESAKDSFSRHGYYILTADNIEQLNKNTEKVEEMLQIKVSENKVMLESTY